MSENAKNPAADENEEATMTRAEKPASAAQPVDPFALAEGEELVAGEHPPLHNPYFKYKMKFPDGKVMIRAGNMAGFVKDLDWIHDTLLHAKPIGTEIVALALTDKRGNVLKDQPALLKMTDAHRARRLARDKELAADPENDGMHPGVNKWVAPPPSPMSMAPEPTMKPVSPSVGREPAGPQSLK